MNLELKNINFSFPKKNILSNINIFFNQGQIHGILGENGAGKSTLANIICGELQPQSGSILLNNENTVLKNSKDAISKGICYVHQKPLLCENISIWENLILGYKFSLRASQRKKQKKEIIKIASSLLPDIDFKIPLYNITSDIRFFISLCGALIKNPQILVLDEPSSLLDSAQVEFLYKKLKQLSSDGMNIIIISHNKEEAKLYFDDIFTIKKESQEFNISSALTKNINDETIAFEWKNIQCKTRNHIPLKNIAFKVQSGEITLISGRAEDGLSLLEDIICGMNNFKAGGTFTISKNSNVTVWDFSSHFSACKLRNKTGIKTGIIPTNKKNRGSGENLTINEMLTVFQNKYSAKQLIKQANVNIEENEKVHNLSGGMLQRLIISREISNNPQLLIMCNPLQGLDSKSEENLCQNLVELTSKNTAILILSSQQFPDQICNRKYKLKQGELIQC